MRSARAPRTSCVSRGGRATLSGQTTGASQRQVMDMLTKNMDAVTMGDDDRAKVRPRTKVQTKRWKKWEGSRKHRNEWPLTAVQEDEESQE